MIVQVWLATRSPYPDARALVDAGVRVALATDCNPGTCFSSSMPFVIALAVREMGLTPMEALRAATCGGAAALSRNDIGHLGVGALARVTLLDAPSYQHLAYRPGVPIARLLVSRLACRQATVAKRASNLSVFTRTDL